MSQKKSITALPTALNPNKQHTFIAILPITLAVFMGFLTIGLQLPVLPLHLNENLGINPFGIGIIVGLQFVVALLSRAWAGNLADLRGAKRAVIIGCLLSAISGMVYLLSLSFIKLVPLSIGLVILGRVLLALGESLLVTGAMGWAFGLVGPTNAGKVMVWTGIAIYGAYALGAPFGIALNAHWGFTGIAMSVLLLPFAALVTILRLPAIAPAAAKRTPFYKVLRVVFWPGMGLAFSSVGFGLLIAFIALLFSAKQWGNSSYAFTAFGLCFIGARVFFGHLPDKIGGAKVALVSVMVEIVGQLLIWQADDPMLAYLGAGLTGFGYSLAYPGFGVEAIRRAPPQTRSLAMGAYVAFMDIALGLTTPLAGALANVQGIAAVYLAGAVTICFALMIAMLLLKQQKPLPT